MYATRMGMGINSFALIGIGLMAAAASGCGSDDAARCVAGRSEQCTCPGGQAGVQTCDNDGRFGPCECVVAPASAPGSEPHAEDMPLAPPTSSEDLQAAADAATAYLEAIRSYAARETSYYGHFADPMTCFHGEQGLTRAQLRHLRALPVTSEMIDHSDRPFITTFALRLLSATDDRVELLDYGAYHTQTTEGIVSQYGAHEKAIRLERQGGQWLIVAEAGTQSAECVPGAFETHPAPASFAQCRDAQARCDRAGRAECARPGMFGNGCALELWKNDCFDELLACLDQAQNGLRIVPTNVTASSHWETESGSRSFPADRAFDGQLDTAWNSGGDNRGAGQWLEAQLTPATEVSEFVLTTGFVPPENAAAFDRNAHARSLHVDVDGRTVVRLAVGQDQREVRIPLGLEASTIRVVFDATWPGSRWEPLAISEVRLLATE